MNENLSGPQFGRFEGTQGMNHDQRRTAQARAASKPKNKKKYNRAAERNQRNRNGGYEG
jgi:hypothetical protein